ncbi:MAG: aromatic amino acid transport family protein [Patescibacteria group bacterium]
MFRNIILPSSLLAGTIIGAGIFALPFLFNKAGILTGLFYLTAGGAIFTLIHLIYADIIVRTKENHRFAGYAKIYFGSFGEWSAILITLVGMVFTLTVYLVLSTSFLNFVLSGIVLPDIFKILIFWFLGSAAIFMGINRLAVSEFLITVGIAAIILLIFIYDLAGHKTISAPLFDFNNFLLPYGAVIFSFAGRVAVPAVLGYFRKNNQPAAKAKMPIILGSLAPIPIYLLFVFGILGLSGTVSEDSISGLVGNLPPLIMMLLGILGIASLWSSYIVIGRDIKKSLEHDFRLSSLWAGLLVVIVPLLFYFLGFQNFLKLVGLVGGVFIGLEGILVILMWLKARKTSVLGEEVIIKKLNPVIVFILLAVFIGGAVYAIL